MGLLSHFFLLQSRQEMGQGGWPWGVRPLEFRKDKSDGRVSDKNILKHSRTF